MPIYEYECPNCKEIMEIFTGKNDDKTIVICGICNKPMTRILSTVSFNVHGYNSKNSYSGDKASTINKQKSHNRRL